MAVIDTPRMIVDKFPVPREKKFILPISPLHRCLKVGAEIKINQLAVNQTAVMTPVLYVMHNPDETNKGVFFVLIQTGEELPDKDNAYMYVDTIMENGQIAWHLFEAMVTEQKEFA